MIESQKLDIMYRKYLPIPSRQSLLVLSISPKSSATPWTRYLLAYPTIIADSIDGLLLAWSFGNLLPKAPDFYKSFAFSKYLDYLKHC